LMEQQAFQHCRRKYRRNHDLPHNGSSCQPEA